MKQLLIFLFLSNLAFGQSKKLSDEDINNSGASRINFIENCNEVEKLAEIDIKNETIILFLQSGEAPIIYYKDETFKKKYNVFFYEQGCIGSNCTKEYNKIIFNYLLNKYGKKWIKQIRKDVIGFKDWKKQL
ncbi:MAG: hypothetical protein PHC28_10365 [Flavobacterium sp.]|uniref:FEKKY domain-containing protein n=1 Tax=Flavobacterium sp. TaxID=239 RepID=UPI002626FC5A|nr:hypothetical protein [Flavobacterium sp.]MDD5150861.1 hypothetical protein [Flavobacterium sp.]